MQVWVYVPVINNKHNIKTEIIIYLSCEYIKIIVYLQIQ